MAVYDPTLRMFALQQAVSVAPRCTPAKDIIAEAEVFLRFLDPATCITEVKVSKGLSIPSI